MSFVAVIFNSHNEFIFMYVKEYIILLFKHEY